MKSSFPTELTCCGLAVYNTGDDAAAGRNGGNTIFRPCPALICVTACATCGTALKGYGEWFSRRSQS